MTQARATTTRQVPEQTSSGHHPLIYIFGVLGFCTFLAIGYFFQLINDPERFPIRKIAVDGEFLNLKPQEVEALVSDAVKGGFFNLDVEYLQNKILINPWIEWVSVRRIWPDSIRVSMSEQDPVAYWGDQALLNEQADIFAPMDMPSDLPLVKLDGPIGTETMVLTQYQTLNKSLQEIGIKIVALKMNKRRSWEFQTVDGVVIKLGRDDLENKLVRLKTAYNGALATNWQRVSMVDLRYTNGLTVQQSNPPAAEIAVR